MFMLKTRSALIPALALVLSMATMAAHADALSLGDNMKQIASLVKSISAAVNTPAQNAQSAANAEQLAALFTTTEAQVPDTITSMAADQQAAAIADYKALIQKEVDAAIALEKAFQANDNAGAAAILQQMNETKVEGHTKFKG